MRSYAFGTLQAPIDPHLVLGGFDEAAPGFRSLGANASTLVVTFPVDSSPATRCARV